MSLTFADVQRTAQETGFPTETVEKVLRLLSLLNALSSHPFLKERLVLKGGTALNLFLFEVPRLSVDIDLNYIGASDRETMLAERPKVEQAITAVCSREGLTIKWAPDDHAGGKWRVSYPTASGQSGNIELDINFLLRVPLWSPTRLDSRPFGGAQARQILVLDAHELVAGKLAALLARRASRDLFDTREVGSRLTLDVEKLRLAFVVYGGLNRIDWRTVAVSEVQAEAKELKSQLVPMLRSGVAPTPQELPGWTSRLVDDCHEFLAKVLPLASRELDFLTRLNDGGELVPELLTGDGRLQTVIREHPALLWKALNVRQHKGQGLTEEKGIPRAGAH
jgi:predicted nucleotidyltransferase component of viral defense system